MTWWLLATPAVAGLLLLTPAGRSRVAALLATGVAFGVLIADLGVLRRATTLGPFGEPVGALARSAGLRLEVDPLSGLFAVTASLVVAFALAWRAQRPATSPRVGAGALIALAGLHGLYFTRDFLGFYLFFEASMTACVLLVAGGRGDPLPRGVLGLVAANVCGSVLFLGALLSLFQNSGNLELAAVADDLAARPGPDGLLCGTVLVVAFALKVGLFPFHRWTASVISDADPAASAVLACAVTGIGAYGLLRFAFGVFPEEAVFAQNALLGWAGVSVVYGGLVAVGRAEARLTLAYASVSQAGLVVLCVAVADLVAGALLAVVDALHRGLGLLAATTRGPVVRGVYLVAVLGLVGLPPTPGFIAKLAVARAAWAAGSFPSAAILGVGAALLLAALAAIKKGPREEVALPRSESADRVVLVVFAALVVGLGVVAGPLARTAEAAP